MRKFLWSPLVVLCVFLSTAVAQPTATPSAVNFQAPLGGTVPPIAVMINGPTGSTFTATSDYGSSNPAGWFSVSPVTLTSGQTVNVSIPSTNLPSGITGTITFLQNGTSNTVIVPVSFTLTASGNGVLIASPPSITLNFTGPISQQVGVTITGPSNAIITASANSGGGPFGWISVTQPSGPPPATFTVTVDPSNLPVGTTSGSVSVTENGTANFVTIPVSAIVPPGTYNYTPNPLTFSVNGFSSTLTDQGLTITGPNNAVVQVTASVNNGGYQWLNVNPQSGPLTNSTLTTVVTVNPVGLAPSQTYTGTIVVTQGGSTVLTIPVTVTTSGVPTVSVTPSQLNFAWQVGTAPPVPQIAAVTTTGISTPVTISTQYASCGSGWLTVGGTTTSATPVPLTVSVNTSALSPIATVAPTTCSGTIQVSAPGATNANTSIPFTLLVSPNPVLQVSPSSLTINYQPGGALPGPWPFTLISSSPGTTQLSFTSTANSGASGTNFLSIAQTSSGTPGVAVAELNPSVVAGLGLGTYTSNLVFTDSTGNSISIPVTLNVANAATLITNPGQLIMNYQIGQPQPASQTVTVSSTGAPLTFSATATSANCGNFLSVIRTGVQSTFAPQIGTSITVSANVTGVTSPTTCVGQVVLTQPSAATPAVFDVIVNVVNQAAINVGSTNITQNAPPGWTTPIIVTVPVASSDNTTVIPYASTPLTVPAGQSWLSISGSNAGSTPGSISVQLNPTGLAVGTYTGVVTVVDNRANSPVPIQAIPVTLIIGNQLSADPPSLTFTQPAAGTAPPSQTVQITSPVTTVGLVLGEATGVSFSASATTSSGGNWLSVTPTSGATPGTLTVSVNSNALPAGSYIGAVTLSAGGGTSPLTIPVNLIIGGTSPLSASPSSLTFTYAAGTSGAPGQNVQVLNSGGAVAFTASASSNITVTPSSGTTPGTISVGVASGLTVGSYTGTVTLTPATGAPLIIPVTVNVTAQSQTNPAVTSIENAASLIAGAVAPGEIVSIFGTNLGPSTPASFQLTSAGKVPTTIGTTQVFFNGTAAPLLYVSATQINAIVPYEIAGSAQTTMTVTSNGIPSSGLTLLVVSSSPAIFTVTQNGSGQAAALNQNGTVNSASNPAARGSVISIYGTGEGQTNPAGVTGSVTPGVPPFAMPAGNVATSFQVPGPGGTITSIPATIQYGGEAPSLVAGVLQVNVVVPNSVPSGAATLVLTVGGNTSTSTVTVQVQ